MRIYLRTAVVLCALLCSATSQARPIFNITPNLLAYTSASNVVYVLPGKTVNVGFRVENVSGTAFAGGLSYQANINATNLFSAKVTHPVIFHSIRFCSTSMAANERCQLHMIVTAGNQLGFATIRPMVCYLGNVCSTATQTVTVVVTDTLPLR